MLTDTEVFLRAGLYPRCIIYFCELLAFRRLDLPTEKKKKINNRSIGFMRTSSLLLQVRFGANDHTRYLLNPTKIQDPIVEDFGHFQGITRRHRVNNNIAMCANCMGGVYERKFVLRCVCLRLFRGMALLEGGGGWERGSGTYVTSGIDDLAIIVCPVVFDSPLE